MANRSLTHAFEEIQQVPTGLVLKIVGIRPRKRRHDYREGLSEALRVGQLTFAEEALRLGKVQPLPLAYFGLVGR